MKRFIPFFAIGVAVVLMLISFGSASPVTAFQANTVTITMQDFQFTPKDITIPVGSSVVWKNAGTKKHTATADDSSFDTGVVAPGTSSAPVVFNKAGTIPYFCQFHGAPGGIDMSGTITVVATAAATAAPVAATAAAAPPAAPVGSVAFADDAKANHADTVKFTFTALPLPPEGQQYEAWLADGKSAPFSLGTVQVKADGTATLVYADPKNANLIGQFNVALITLQGTDLTTPGTVAFSGLVPPSADVHVRHIMSKFPSTPNNIGLLLGALDQESVLTQHVAFLNDAISKGNLANAKLHLEHIHNILTGTTGAKDLNGDGKLQISPPGDGFGLFNYLTLTVQHADLAAQQPDATDVIKVKANHIKIASINATGLLTQIQALSITGAGLTTTAAIKPIADQITKLNGGVVKGVPDASGAVTPTKGSAGLGLAYNEGLAMGSFNLVAGDVTAALSAQTAPAATTVATTAPAAATTAPPAATQAAAANTVTINLKDFEFDPKTITIKAGTSVIFVNTGTKKHTATADDNSFDTGVILPGASSAPVLFSKPGVVPFYCQFHGGPGGVDMSGVITVQ